MSGYRTVLGVVLECTERRYSASVDHRRYEATEYGSGKIVVSTWEGRKVGTYRTMAAAVRAMQRDAAHDGEG